MFHNYISNNSIFDKVNDNDIKYIFTKLSKKLTFNIKLMLAEPNNNNIHSVLYSLNEFLNLKSIVSSMIYFSKYSKDSFNILLSIDESLLNILENNEITTILYENENINKNEMDILYSKLLNNKHTNYDSLKNSFIVPKNIYELFPNKIKNIVVNNKIIINEYSISYIINSLNSYNNNNHKILDFFFEKLSKVDNNNYSKYLEILKANNKLSKKLGYENYIHMVTYNNLLKGNNNINDFVTSFDNILNDDYNSELNNESTFIELLLKKNESENICNQELFDINNSLILIIAVYQNIFDVNIHQIDKRTDPLFHQYENIYMYSIEKDKKILGYFYLDFDSRFHYDFKTIQHKTNNTIPIFMICVDYVTNNISYNKLSDIFSRMSNIFHFLYSNQNFIINNNNFNKMTQHLFYFLCYDKKMISVFTQNLSYIDRKNIYRHSKNHYSLKYKIHSMISKYNLIMYSPKFINRVKSYTSLKKIIENISKEFLSTNHKTNSVFPLFMSLSNVINGDMKYLDIFFDIISLYIYSKYFKNSDIIKSCNHYKNLVLEKINKKDSNYTIINNYIDLNYPFIKSFNSYFKINNNENNINDECIFFKYSNEDDNSNSSENYINNTHTNANYFTEIMTEY